MCLFLQDIAIMTNNVTRCPYYQFESQNVKSRWHCVLPHTFMYQHMNDNNLKLPNNQEDCKVPSCSVYLLCGILELLTQTCKNVCVCVCFYILYFIYGPCFLDNSAHMYAKSSILHQNWNPPG